MCLWHSATIVNQGIVPVPESIENGQKPSSNLYWGAGYGVKNYFHKKSSSWTLVKTIKNPNKGILERIIFKHKTEDIYLLADAYDGAEIKATISDFFDACAGHNTLEINLDEKNIRFGGSSNLIAYVGHDGLMEFSLEKDFSSKDTNHRDAIMLACASKDFFASYLKQTGAYPLVWTTGLMAPEAYTLEWAIGEWILNKSNEEVAQKAAAAYNHYQKCGINGARRLLVTGW